MGGAARGRRVAQEARAILILAKPGDPEESDADVLRENVRGRRERKLGVYSPREKQHATARSIAP